MSNLNNYLPLIYKGIRETAELMSVEDTLLTAAQEQHLQVLNNQYILNANEDGIAAFEHIFKIVPNLTTESIEFRRQRLLNRSSTAAPLTVKFLEQKLDEIIGVGAWSLTLDSNNYTLYIETSAENQLWYHELLVTINAVKPVNIVFINKPLITGKIKATEDISKSYYNWNYVLGVSWQLGVLPFASRTEEEFIKLSTTPSIDNTLLNSVATFTANKVDKVRINNTHLITTFTTKAATNNTVTVEYEIPNSVTDAAITKVELLDSGSNALATATVYVPVLADLVFKHTLIIEEG